jgi:hypothetical protein
MHPPPWRGTATFQFGTLLRGMVRTPPVPEGELLQTLAHALAEFGVANTFRYVEHGIAAALEDPHLQGTMPVKLRDGRHVELRFAPVPTSSGNLFTGLTEGHCEQRVAVRLGGPDRDRHIAGLMARVLTTGFRAPGARFLPPDRGAAAWSIVDALDGLPVEINCICHPAHPVPGPRRGNER